ncbi:hypothetical protein FOL47_002152 [Perkinsus chesapeaki]|uniref:Uncharacterized protein n=1 Tax=Perkinsus chesapeaki TaxID=330153 RepID=A0A7J6KQJ2_PERCH|nr:hypothetical protein FOL47_002152 [Perkinsus chesapeaki]
MSGNNFNNDVSRHAEDLRPQAPHGHHDIDAYRKEIWSPGADLATVTTGCKAVQNVIDYNVNLSMFGSSNVIPPADTTRVTTPRISTTGVLTFDYVPKIDVTILNDFETALCSLKLVTTLLVDTTTWHRINPCLRLFIKSGQTYFNNVPDGSTLTNDVLSDNGLREEEVILTTLGELLRWSLVESLFTACGCWDVKTTNYVLGVPKLPHDASLDVRKVGRLRYFIATMDDGFNTTNNVYMRRMLYNNVGDAMSNVFSKYEHMMQFFDVDDYNDMVKLDALRVAKQRHYFYVGEWAGNDD